MKRLRDLREDRDLRQIDVANSTGIDQKTLSNYETGKTNPDSEALIKLSRFFGVSVDYLIGISDLSISSHSDIIRQIDSIQSELECIKRSIKR